MDVDLECPICLEPYDLHLREPKVLPCSGAHELCQACALAMRVNGTVGGQDMKCPTCREMLPAGRPINTNRGLLAALKQQIASAQERAQLARAAATAQAEVASVRAQAEAAAEEARTAREQAASEAPQEEVEPAEDHQQQQRRRPRHGGKNLGKGRGARHGRGAERVRTDPLADEQAQLQRQNMRLIIALLVLGIAILGGLWVGRRSGAEFVNKIAFDDLDKHLMDKHRDKSMRENLKTQKDIHEMTPTEMENHLSLSTDIEANARDPHGDGDQSRHKAESPAGKILREVWTSGADYSDVMNEGTSIIHRLAVFGDIRSLGKLLNRSDDVERHRLLEKRISVLRVTPLMAAVTARRYLPKEALQKIPRQRHVEIAKLLLKAGARTEAKDVAGHTALHKAVGEFATPTSWAIAKEILQAGGDIDAKNRFGETTLFRVACIAPGDGGVDRMVGDGMLNDFDPVLIPDMAVWLVASGANMDLGTFGVSHERMTPRECPPLPLQRVLLFAEAQRKLFLAKGPYTEADSISLGPGLQKYERRDGSKTTLVEEAQPQEKLEKMAPQIKKFVLEAKSWKPAASSA